MKTAVELVVRFIRYTPADESMELPYAKQCALIAVAFARENPLNTVGYNKYLDEVKTEIENI